MKHYIAMAGLHGCIPNWCDVYSVRGDAVESAAQLHELGSGRRRKLAQDSYLELNLHRDGNEYIEITACECATPCDHHEACDADCGFREVPK